MATIEQLERLLKAIKPVCDRHMEQPVQGHSFMNLPITRLEMKELRSALEPFRWSQQEIDEAKREAADLAAFLNA